MLTTERKYSIIYAAIPYDAHCNAYVNLCLKFQIKLHFSVEAESQI
jgi:hypothetical protein